MFFFLCLENALFAKFFFVVVLKRMEGGGTEEFLIYFFFSWLDSNLEDTFFFGWEFGAKGAAYTRLINKIKFFLFNSRFDGLNC